MVEPVKYARKPFHIDAIQVTPENIEEVATWAKGTVKTDGTKQFVKVRVHRPANDRQTKAYVGDWVLLSSQGFKVYNNKAFAASFEPASA